MVCFCLSRSVGCSYRFRRGSHFLARSTLVDIRDSHSLIIDLSQIAPLLLSLLLFDWGAPDTFSEAPLSELKLKVKVKVKPKLERKLKPKLNQR